MALSAYLHATSSPHQSMLWTLGLRVKVNQLSFMTDCKRKSHSLWITKSVLNNRKSSISDSGASEPVRILLESLFAQTQKLEEQIGRDSSLPQVVELGFNLGKLESDLQAALEALKKKEEDLQDMERKVFLESTEVNQIKYEFEQREAKILAACSKQEKLEGDLRQANLKLASQAREIEDLMLRLKERDEEISASQSALCLKEDEMNKMKNELMKKTEVTACTETELRSKALLLNEANEVVKRQELEVQELRKAIQEKEEQLEVSMKLRKVEEDKLKVAEASLEGQTTDWIFAQKELKKLAEEVSKHTGEASEAMEDFRRVKKLLSDVRCELVSSQKVLVSSRQIMEDQEQLLEKQLIELAEQKRIIVSYLTSLKDAQTEVESERVKLRAAEARNKELGRDLSMEKELNEELKRELCSERTSLQQSVQEKFFLQEDLDRRSTEYGEAQSLLQVKESELVEARLEIQHLKSEQASFLLILEDKEVELCGAWKMLEEVNQQIAELRTLMNSKEDQLVQATTMLKEKDEHVQTIQHEFHDTQLKLCEAESVIERIVELTNKLVKNEHYDALSPSEDMGGKLSHLMLGKQADDFIWQNKQLETQLNAVNECLKVKEKEVLETEMALAIKDEELKMVQGRLDAKEDELKKMKKESAQDNDELRRLSALAQEKIGERSIGDFMIENLQLKTAQLQVEAATSALYKLTQMSRDFFNKASLTIEADLNTNVFQQNGYEIESDVTHKSFSEIRAEVARLSYLTEQLLKEADIVGNVR